MIRAYQDGDVWRIVDGQGRRYYYDPAESSGGFFAEARFSREPDSWDRCTAFTEREARLLNSAFIREQRIASRADAMATALIKLGEAFTTAKEWQSGREHA